MRLKFNKPGFFLDIPGSGMIRTPFDITIQKQHEKRVLGLLKFHNKEYYEISNIDDMPNIEDKKINRSTKEKPKVKKDDMKNNLDLDERLKNIEGMIITLLGRSSTTNIYNTIGEKTSEENLNYEDHFIPEVDFGNMISTTTNMKTEESIYDIDDIVSQLKNIKGQI